MLKINTLKVKYNKQVALDIREEILIEEGDRIGIIGNNGAGKTTLINAILNLVDYQGQIKRDLQDNQIGVHMQFNNFPENMSCKSIIEMILDTSIKKDQKLRDLIAYFEMEDHINKGYKSLSGGQKQRFTLILVLYQEKKLNFFDEVTSGLDFESRQKLMEKLNDWYKNKDSALCLVSHYYEELEELTNKILILEEGRLVDFGDKNHLFKKYCGNKIYIVDKSDFNENILKEHKKILSPKNLIVVPVNSKEEEKNLSKLLIEKDIDFKRSSNDIEIMFTNARADFLRRRQDD